MSKDNNVGPYKQEVKRYIPLRNQVLMSEQVSKLEKALSSCRKDPIIPSQKDNHAIAVVKEPLAYEITQTTERAMDELATDSLFCAAFGSPERRGNMYLSRYGLLGYVEYDEITTPSIAGIIRVPARLDLLLNSKDSTLYEKIKNDLFGNWELNKHKERTYFQNIRDYKFIDENYFWATINGIKILENNDVVQTEITQMNKELKEKIILFDTKIDAFVGATPSLAGPYFRRLKQEGIKI